MENIWTIIISAATGGIFTLFTTYISTLVSSRKERQKWESETAIKFIDYSLSNPDLARKISRQFSIAIIVHIDNDGSTNNKYFLPAFCRISIGRNDNHDICIDDPYLSRDHGLFYYNNGKIIYKDTSSTNKTLINNKAITKRRKLKTGDYLLLGRTQFRFDKL